MDRNSSPTYVEPSPEHSVQATEQLIDHIHSLTPLPTSSPLVHPIITPRFAISCSDVLLSSLGSLAAKHPNMAIQTHISENATEIELTKKLFPDAPHYAGVYDMFGLLREGTILGHACHLTEDEIELVKLRDAGIAHCPTSNFNIRSGMARVGRYLDRGIKVSFSLQDPHYSMKRGLIHHLILGWPRHRLFWRLCTIHLTDHSRRLYYVQNSLFDPSG
jgi:guanine deaminase